MKFGLILGITILFSCHSNENIHNEKKQEPTKIERIKHPQLLAFKSDFLAELGDEKYDSLTSILNRQEIIEKHLNDSIYISLLTETDACGDYCGNIEIKDDTINLKYDLISEFACTALAIKRITYLVSNPKTKKYTINLK